MRELERRHLVPDSRMRSRREYTLQLALDNAPSRALHDFQDLEAAGLRNNSSIRVMPCIRGGAPGYISGMVTCYRYLIYILTICVQDRT